jgi:hypothetical protein
MIVGAEVFMGGPIVVPDVGAEIAEAELPPRRPRFEAVTTTRNLHCRLALPGVSVLDVSPATLANAEHVEPVQLCHW